MLCSFLSLLSLTKVTWNWFWLVQTIKVACSLIISRFLRFLRFLSLTQIPGTGSDRCRGAEWPPRSGSAVSSASSP